MTIFTKNFFVNIWYGRRYAFPLDTGHKLIVCKTFRSFLDIFWTSYVRLIYVLCPTGLAACLRVQYLNWIIQRLIVDVHFLPTNLKLHFSVVIKVNIFSLCLSIASHKQLRLQLMTKRFNCRIVDVTYQWVYHMNT